MASGADAQGPAARWKGLLELGFPAELPAPPMDLNELLAIRAPEPFATVARYVRGAGIEWLIKQELAWGIGVGFDEATQGPALALLIPPGKRDEALGRLPGWIETEGKRFNTTLIEISRSFDLNAGDLITTPYAGARSGCFLSTSPDGMYEDQVTHQRIFGGGTLSGVFPSAAGHSLRALTCAHVALDAGIENLLNQLPNSLRDLLASPKGKHMFAWDNHDDPTTDYSGWGVGDPYILFEVDTDTRILTPIPFVPGMSPAIAALMPIFLYTDVAAGDVRPVGIPNHPSPPAPPPAKRQVHGGVLHGGKIALPNDRYYSTGSASGTRWGSIVAMSVITIWPLPPIIPFLPPQFLIFDLDVHSNKQDPGDSGEATVLVNGHHVANIRGLGPFGVPYYLAAAYSKTDI